MLLIVTGYFGMSVYGLTTAVGSALSNLITTAGKLRKSKNKRRKQRLIIDPDIEPGDEKIAEENWTPPEVVTQKELVTEESKVEDLPEEGEMIQGVENEEETVTKADRTTNEEDDENQDEIHRVEFTVKEQIVEKEVDYDAERAEYAKREYNLPSVELLDVAPQPVEDQISKEEIMNNARLLENTLESFGVSAKVVEVHPGPVITRFELEPRSSGISDP